jgi:hypothetical protein
MFQNDYKRLGHSVICSIDYWLLYVNRKFKWYELSGSEMRNMFILFSWQCVWNYRESEMRNMFILFSWQCVWNYRDQKWEICSFCSLDNVCEIIGIRNGKYVHSVLLTMCVKLSGSEMRNMFILFSWQCVWNSLHYLLLSKVVVLCHVPIVVPCFYDCPFLIAPSIFSNVN